jgi:hypothetical protein
MPVLHHPVFRQGMVAIRGGAVQANAGHFQVIDVYRCLPQVGLQGFPGGLLAQAAQHDLQPVITEFGTANGLPQQPFQRLAMLPGPLFYAGLAMVAFREDRGQPDRCQPAVTQPLVVAVVAQVAVQNFGKVQFLRKPDQQRDVINSLVG